MTAEFFWLLHLEKSVSFGSWVICLWWLLKKNKSGIKESYLAQWMYVPCVCAGHKHGYSNCRLLLHKSRGQFPSEQTKRHYPRFETWPNFTDSRAEILRFWSLLTNVPNLFSYDRGKKKKKKNLPITWSFSNKFVPIKSLFSCWVMSDSFATPMACSQLSLFMGFPRQEYWMGCQLLLRVNSLESINCRGLCKLDLFL